MVETVKLVRESSHRKIGWYCPYTLPPILQKKNIKTVQLQWNQGKNSCFGNVKLCKKMTSLLEIVERRELDGLVMPECCNLSYSILEFLKKEYRGLSLYSIYVPRKVDTFFLKTLYNQWNALYDKLGSNGKTPSGESNKNIFIWDTEKEIIKQSNDFSLSFRSKIDWCTLPKDIEIRGKDFKEIIYDLMKTVNCPRLLFENKEGIYKPRSYQSFQAQDEQCILQKYYVSIDV